MSFCSNCGAKYSEGDRFCQGCGYKFTEDGQVVVNTTNNEPNQLVTSIKEALEYYKGLILRTTDTSEKIFKSSNKGLSFIITIFSALVNCILYMLLVKKVYSSISSLMPGNSYYYGESILPKFNYFYVLFQGILIVLIPIALIYLGLYIISKVYNGENTNIIKIIAIASVPITCVNILGYIVSFIGAEIAIGIVVIGTYAAMGSIFTNTNKYITGGKEANLAVAATIMVGNMGFAYTVFKLYSKVIINFASRFGGFF